MKKRILVLLTMVVLMVLMLAMSANCAGKSASGQATSNGQGFGQDYAYLGQALQGIGQEISPLTSSSCGAR
jgi:hypothetical protein